MWQWDEREQGASLNSIAVLTVHAAHRVVPCRCGCGMSSAAETSWQARCSRRRALCVTSQHSWMQQTGEQLAIDAAAVPFHHVLVNHAAHA